MSKSGEEANTVASSIHATCHLDPLSLIERSSLDENAAVYRSATVLDSRLSRSASVGDSAKVDHGELQNSVKIGRFSYITHSRMGSHSYTGPNTMVLHSTIGKFCSISWGVTIGAGEHDFHRVTSHSFLYDPSEGLLNGQSAWYNRFELPCEIGNDVWIGANATVLRGARVGDGAVIGANALVRSDIPPYAIAVGVPAKVIRYRFPEKMVCRLLSIAWWNLPDNVIRDHTELFAAEPDDQILDAIAELVRKECEAT